MKKEQKNFLELVPNRRNAFIMQHKLGASFQLVLNCVYLMERGKKMFKYLSEKERQKEKKQLKERIKCNC